MVQCLYADQVESSSSKIYTEYLGQVNYCVCYKMMDKYFKCSLGYN